MTDATPWYNDDAQVEIDRLSTALDTASEEIARLNRELERNAERDRYNGWTNYATWRVNLEILDDYLGSLSGTLADEKWSDTGSLADHLSEYLDELLADSNDASGNSIAVDYARAFVSDVNYYEIAEHYPDLVESDEDDTEEEGD